MIKMLTPKINDVILKKSLNTNLIESLNHNGLIVLNVTKNNINYRIHGYTSYHSMVIFIQFNGDFWCGKIPELGLNNVTRTILGIDTLKEWTKEKLIELTDKIYFEDVVEDLEDG